MIVYNELIAITAGAALLGFAAFLADLVRNKRVDSEGWAGSSGSPAYPARPGRAHHCHLALRRRRIRVRQHRLRSACGRLRRALLFAAVYLWRHRALFDGDVETANAAALASFKPAGIFVGVLGLGMAVLASSLVRFQLGAAPPEEPISGRSDTFRSLRRCSSVACGGSSPSVPCSSRSRCGPTARDCSAEPSGPGSLEEWCSCCSAR